MKRKRILYRAWLSIILTNVINLSMIIFSIKLKLNSSIENLKEESRKLMSTQNQNMGIEPKIHDLEAVFNDRSPKSQLDRIRKKNIIRVAIVEKKAYWVHDNVFYEAEVIDGEINNNDAKPIDATNLSQSQIKKLMDILDRIS